LRHFQVLCQGLDSLFVAFIAGQLQQLGRIGEILIQLAQGRDNLLQAGAFPTQRLCLVRIVPDIGIFEFAIDLD
jgi:hypothetical protein